MFLRLSRPIGITEFFTSRSAKGETYPLFASKIPAPYWLIYSPATSVPPNHRVRGRNPRGRNCPGNANPAGSPAGHHARQGRQPPVSLARRAAASLAAASLAATSLAATSLAATSLAATSLAAA